MQNRLSRYLAVVLIFSTGLSIFAQNQDSGFDNLRDRARKLISSGDYNNALPLVEEALRIAQTTYGENNAKTAEVIGELANVHFLLAHYPEAEKLYLRAIASYEAIGESEEVSICPVLSYLATLYMMQGRYSESESTLRRIVSMAESSSDPEYETCLVLGLAGLGSLYALQNKFDEAEEVTARLNAITKKMMKDSGIAVPEGATSDAEQIMDGLTAMLAQMSDEEQEADLKFWLRSVFLSQRALQLELDGRHPEAEKSFLEALDLLVKHYGDQHHYTAAAHADLAGLYLKQNRLNEAVEHYRTAIPFLEKKEDRDLAYMLCGLALAYESLGQYAEADESYGRCLRLRVTTFGSGHPFTAHALYKIGKLREKQNRPAEESAMFIQNASHIYLKLYPQEHPFRFHSLPSLDEKYDAIERMASISDRATAGMLEWIRENQGRPAVANHLMSSVQQYYWSGRFSEAKPFLTEALKIYEEDLGADHPQVAHVLHQMARFSRAEQNLDAALSSIRRATAIYKARLGRWSTYDPDQDQKEFQSIRQIFLTHLEILYEASENSKGESSLEEVFELFQLSRLSTTGRTIANMAARFSTSNNELSRAVRAYQSTVSKWHDMNEAFLKQVNSASKDRNREAEKSLRKEIAGLEIVLEQLELSLKKRFPDYSEMANSQIISLNEAQDILDPDEALIAYQVHFSRSFVFVIRSNSSTLLSLDLPEKNLTEFVNALRKGLTNYNEGQNFDLKVAHELYRRAFEPMLPYLKDVSHVLVVPDKALESLPLSILPGNQPEHSPTQAATVTTEKQRIGKRATSKKWRMDIEALQSARWLAHQFGFSTLPSISSFRALRKTATGSRASKPFLGIGDPLLTSTEPSIEKIVSQLSPLPETATELTAIARNFRAKKDSIYVREAASEEQLKRLNKSGKLNEFRVLAFSTHGLLAYDFSELDEPALILTPSQSGKAGEDGLLRASEISELQLNADWVLLSACNTAAPDGTPGAEGLSGLAKAFFFAGARTLLVSHWPVSSYATVQLMSTTFNTLAGKPGMRRAEALRRAMISLINDATHPEYAHPSYWAPFVIVGDGGKPF